MDIVRWCGYLAKQRSSDSMPAYIDGLVQERRDSSALAMSYVFLALTHRYVYIVDGNVQTLVKIAPALYTDWENIIFTLEIAKVCLHNWSPGWHIGISEMDVFLKDIDEVVNELKPARSEKVVPFMQVIGLLHHIE